MFNANNYVELEVKASGTTTDWLSVDDSPGLWNGRNWAVVYVLATGDSNGEVMLQVRPVHSAEEPVDTLILSAVNAFQNAITIDGETRSAIADFNAARGMELRVIVNDYTGTGSINVRLDLGVS